MEILIHEKTIFILQQGLVRKLAYHLQGGLNPVFLHNIVHWLKNKMWWKNLFYDIIIFKVTESMFGYQAKLLF